jgi:protein-disulfide isomerase
VDEVAAVDLDRHVYGAVDAPITVVEYGDFECPYCGAAASQLRVTVRRDRDAWRTG